jgi:hypothetical protein
VSAIDHWDWIRYVLALALVACNIGVWRGVALEEDETSWGIRELGKSLLIKSLALEALFAACLFVVDTKIALDQKWEIEKLRLANNALAAQIAPRRLSDSNIAALKLAVGPFRDRQISIWSYGLDIEGRLLAGQIKMALKDAQFPVIDRIGAMVSSVVPRVGIIISGPDDKLISALLTALKPFSPTRGPTPGGNVTYGPMTTPIVSAEIFVGLKPVPK